jgi:PAS domain S-box-containing protein
MYSVLYVDDEPGLLELGKVFLESNGAFSVDTSLSALSALDALAVREYDAIVSDYQMPGMDGIVFLKAVRERYADIPFVLFTGKGREEVVIAAINSGADFYLQKGGNPRAQYAELAHSIRQAVRRREAERELRQSEERYRSVVNDQTEMIARFAPDGTIPFTNESFRSYHEHLLGLKEFTSRNLHDLLLAQDSRKVEEAFASLSAGEPMREIERRVVGADGEEHWQLWAVRALLDGAGRTTEYQVVGRDVTESKRSQIELQSAYEQLTATEEELREQFDALVLSEKQIRESEVRFRTIYDHAPYGVILTRADDGVILSVNAAFERHTGYGASDAVGKNPVQLGLISRETLERMRSERLAGRPVVRVPVLVTRRSGEQRHQLFSAVPLTINDLPSVLTLVEDITDQIRAEMQLREEKAFSDAVLDSIPGLLYLYDEDWRLVRWNRNHETLTGYSAAELAGMHVLDWFEGEPEEVAIIRDGMIAGFTDGHADVEANLRTKHGDRIRFRFTAVRLEIGGRRYVTGIGIDISSRAKAEVALCER